MKPPSVTWPWPFSLNGRFKLRSKHQCAKVPLAPLAVTANKGRWVLSAPKVRKVKLALLGLWGRKACKVNEGCKAMSAQLGAMASTGKTVGTALTGVTGWMVALVLMAPPAPKAIPARAARKAPKATSPTTNGMAPSFGLKSQTADGVSTWTCAAPRVRAATVGQAAGVEAAVVRSIRPVCLLPRKKHLWSFW